MLKLRVIRSFHTNIRFQKQLPRPSESYMSDVGHQPIPLTAKELAEKDVEQIDVPSASVDEKKAIKKAMIRRSLRMTVWQLFLITLLGSSVLNIMREKNMREELSENYERKFNLLTELKLKVDRGEATIEDVRTSLKSMNERFVDVFGLKASEFTGFQGLDEEAVRRAYKEVKGVEVKNDMNVNKLQSKEEKLDKFL